MQVAEEDIERMVETIKVGDTTLKFRMEIRIPQCYKCGYITAECPPPTMKNKEKEGEKVVDARKVLGKEKRVDTADET